MGRIIIAVLGGVVISFLFGLVTSKVPTPFTNYLSIFLGSSFAGYFVGKKGWLWGSIVAILLFVFVTTFLWFIGRAAGLDQGMSEFLKSTLVDWKTLYFPTLFGPISGHAGELLSKTIRKKR